MDSTTIAQKFIQDNNQFITEGTDPREYIIQHDTGYKFKGAPNKTAYVKKLKSNTSLTYPGATVFDVYYTFDENGIRNVPVSECIDNHAIFFGDSQAFGEGVNDDETLPFCFQKESKYRSYNYAFPGHGIDNMLGWLKSDEFKNRFKNKSGEIFYIYRDDSIKTCNNLGYERTADEFTDEHYSKALQLLLDSKKTISNISSNFNFTVVVLPLSFSHKKISEILTDNNINTVNLFYTDLGYLTNTKSRWLDGTHTGKSNRVLSKLLVKHYKDGLIHNDYFNDTSINSVESRVEIESFFMSYMIDFPVDDSGVIISEIVKSYSTYNITHLFEISKVKHIEKLHLIDTLKKLYILPYDIYEPFINDNLHIDTDKLQQVEEFKNLQPYYKQLFINLYIKPYVKN